MSTYRIKFKQQFAAYNAGEIGYFTAPTAQALVTGAVGSALDALPTLGVVPTPAPGTNARAILSRSIPMAKATTVADSDAYLNEAAVYVRAGG